MVRDNTMVLSLIVVIKLGGEEMKRYIRAMFHGSRKTKIYMWTMVLVAIFSLVCFFISITGGGINFFYLAFGGGLFCVMYSQLAVFKDVDAETKEQNGKTKVKTKEYKDLKTAGSGVKGYTEEDVRKLMVAYKVKRESFLVLIDSSEKYKIKKCPAYMWVDKYYVYFLLFENTPRVLTVPRKEMEILSYEKGIIIKDMEEYKDVKESMFLNSLCKDLYPQYYRNMVNGLTTFMKNLFVLGEDMRFTTGSVRGVMKLLKCRFELSDKQFDSKRFGSYFGEIYKANLLLKENVYTPQEYEENVKEQLQNLAEHEEQIQEFQSTIYKLVQYRLISDEIAEFYLDYREKLEEKKFGGKKGSYEE